MTSVMAWRGHATGGFWASREEIIKERRNRKNKRDQADVFRPSDSQKSSEGPWSHHNSVKVEEKWPHSGTNLLCDIGGGSHSLPQKLRSYPSCLPLTTLMHPEARFPQRARGSTLQSPTSPLPAPLPHGAGLTLVSASCRLSSCSASVCSRSLS